MREITWNSLNDRQDASGSIESHMKETSHDRLDTNSGFLHLSTDYRFAKFNRCTRNRPPWASYCTSFDGSMPIRSALLFILSRPPALRITCASPSASPANLAGSKTCVHARKNGELPSPRHCEVTLVSKGIRIRLVCGDHFFENGTHWIPPRPAAGIAHGGRLLWLPPMSVTTPRVIRLRIVHLAGSQACDPGPREGYTHGDVRIQV